MMRKGSLVLVFMLAACARHQPQYHAEAVVEESYVHRYGVPIAPSDWTARGESGKVVSTLRNGVVVTKSYSNGVLQGETTYTFPHSEVIERVETYNQGTLFQTLTYSRVGAPVEKITYPAPGRKQTQSWYDNGALRSEESYEQELLVKGDYYDNAHRLESKIENATGLRTQRDGTGHLSSTEKVEGGVVVLEQQFYPNGSLRQLTPYVHGQIEGTVKKYLPTGEPDVFETWVAGEQNGIAIFFEHGEKVAEVPFVRGVREGIEKRYKDGVTVVEEITWSENEQHGPTTAYIGQTAQTEWYYKGKPVTRFVFERMTGYGAPR